MLKYVIAAASGLLLAGSVQAAPSSSQVDHYFSTMQLSIDSANDLGERCSRAIKAGKPTSSGICVSFEQSYSIVLDQSERLNKELKDANQQLPRNDPRLSKLHSSAKQLNSYADDYYAKADAGQK
ncbi:hypothetical protein [Carnimonas nigrificans]|uniref:hypothetical protein n=1 Tax=Carnimonas nigrificans TaxID=64323 RepID=UPI0004718A93|nr:hypothetical protein [Carnimonas nigrificans]